MKRKEFLAAQGFNVGAGRPSRAVMDALAAYRAEHGRFDDDPITKVVTVKSSGPVVSKERIDAGEIRKWARANNVPVGERGKIHPDVVSAYRAAHDGSAPVTSKTVAGSKHVGAETPLSYPLDSKWKSVDGKYVVGPATACYNCKCSLAYHRCNNPRVVARDGNGSTPVILVQSRETVSI